MSNVVFVGISPAVDRAGASAVAKPSLMILWTPIFANSDAFEDVVTINVDCFAACAGWCVG